MNFMLLPKLPLFQKNVLNVFQNNLLLLTKEGLSLLKNVPQSFL